jgi:hypothetical protein
MKVETIKTKLHSWFRLGYLLVLLAGMNPAQAFYNPTTGRWISRDPVEEAESANLCAFDGNDLVGFYDVLGLFVERPSPLPVPTPPPIPAQSVPAPKPTPAPVARPTPSTAPMLRPGPWLVLAYDPQGGTKIRRCTCKGRHPTWPKCSGPSDAISAVLIGAQGLYPGWSPFSAEVRDERPASPLACPSGGTWHAVKTQFFAVLQSGTAYHTMSMSVVCCNCCGTFLEGKSCRIIHPGRGSGGTPPPPSGPPFSGSP